MREWRKLFAGITESDKIALVSDGAVALFCFLVSKQDDAGRYPWAPAKIRVITATRQWTAEQAQAFAQELRNAELITLHDGYVEIVGGAEKNGVPTQGSGAGRPRHYDVNSKGIPKEFQWTSNGLPMDFLEERREDKTPPVVPPLGDPSGDSVDDGTDKAGDSQPSRATGPAKKTSRRATPPVRLTVSDELAAAMIARYRDILGADGVVDEIERALAHEAAQKYKADPNAYVKGWLGREARQAQANGRSPTNVHGAPQRTIDDFPGPEPPREDRQAHTAWVHERETWWQANRPRPPTRSRGP